MTALAMLPTPMLVDLHSANNNALHHRHPQHPAHSPMSMSHMKGVPDVNAVAGPSILPAPQSYTVQIIQLDECQSPPPPRFAIGPASRYSSSACSSDDEEEEEEEEECTSYCSSEDEDEDDGFDDEAEQERKDDDMDVDMDVDTEAPTSPSSDTHSLRMKRILSWRENFSALVRDCVLDSTLLTVPNSNNNNMKRKFSLNFEDDYNSEMSRTSKRSRSQASSSQISHTTSTSSSCQSTSLPGTGPGSGSAVAAATATPASDASMLGSASRPHAPWSMVVPLKKLGSHACPACDASFDNAEALRQHGKMAKELSGGEREKEACYEAVEYAFE